MRRATPASSLQEAGWSHKPSIQQNNCPLAPYIVPANFEKSAQFRIFRKTYDPTSIRPVGTTSWRENMEKLTKLGKSKWLQMAAVLRQFYTFAFEKLRAPSLQKHECWQILPGKKDFRHLTQFFCPLESKVWGKCLWGDVKHQLAVILSSPSPIFILYNSARCNPITSVNQQ